MKILAIETATEACSAALYDEGEIISRYELAPRKHTQLILPMMDSILAEAGVSKNSIDAVAFGRGPGAFTGLRIAVGVAQGLALAIDRPVIPISSLATMAQQMIDLTSNLLPKEITTLMPAIDARMGEVYWGEYENKGGYAVLKGEENITKPEGIAQRNKHTRLVFGSGWEAYHEKLMLDDSTPLGASTHRVFPNAYYVAQLAVKAFSEGHIIDAADAEPVYLRNDVAKKKADQGKSAQ